MKALTRFEEHFRTWSVMFAAAAGGGVCVCVHVCACVHVCMHRVCVSACMCGVCACV